MVSRLVFRRLSAAAVSLAALALPTTAVSQIVTDPDLTLETVVTGLTNPTTMVFIGPDIFLINEQSTGRIRLVQNGVISPTPVLDLPVATGLEPGLHGIIKHPDFSENGFIYVYYTQSTVDGGPRLANRISRFTWNNSVFDPASEFVLHELPAAHSSHHGGILAMGPDGTIYAAIGDQHANEQTTNFPNGGPREVGVIVRFHQDGSVPADNPFVGVEGWEYIFAYGIRNQYGIGFDPLTGNLWQSENGPDNDTKDEVNLFTAGANGGWESLFGFGTPGSLFEVPGSHYSPPKFVSNTRSSPTAAVFQPSPVLGEAYYNSLFIAEGHFSPNHRVFHFRLNETRDGFVYDNPALEDHFGDNNVEMNSITLVANLGIITDVEIGPEGFMYIVDRTGGRVSRVRPIGPTGDGDHDGDIDFGDFKALQLCFGGSGTEASQSCRDAFDFDGDGDVDASDFDTFNHRTSGPLDF